MSESDRSVSNELDRDIGLIGAISLGMGTMIAAGIFVLSGLAVSNVGAAAIVSFLLAGVVAGFTALAYAEFSALYPESGGGYAYVANVFDSDLTYIVGWSIILGYPASAAFYLASFASWFERFLYPALNIPQAIPYWISGIAVLGLLVAVNLKGTEETGMFQIVVTGLKVALILLFLFGGLQAFDASVIRTSFANNITQFAEIGVTTTLVFITFFGFEAIATNAEEIKEPGRNIPRAIFISMGLVSVVYALVVLVIVFAINDQTFLTRLAQQVGEISGVEQARQYVASHGEVSMAYASQYYLGNIGFYVIIVGALLSMISAANATILAGSRVKLAMSRRGHLPDVFNDLSEKYNTPYASVLFTGGLILFYILVFSVLFGTPPGSESGSTPLGIHLGLHSIAHFADFMLLAGLIFVNIALIRSRQKEPDLDRSFTVPLVPWIPAIAILANLVLVTQVETKALIIGLIAEAVGVVFWFGWMRRAREHGDDEERSPTISSRSQVTTREREEQLLVPIARTENVKQLMRTAIDIAKDRNAEILVMSAVTVPAQTPFNRADRFVDEEKDVVDKAMALTDGSDVPVHGLVRVGHDPDETILHTIDQHDCDAVLMGWGGEGNHRRSVDIGSTVDDVVQQAEADVLVERIGPDAGDEVDSILVPTAGGEHAQLAAEVANAIARSEGATCTVAHVVSSGDERDHAQEALQETADVIDQQSVETEILVGADISDRILQETANHDVTVVGATRQSRVRQIVFGAIPERIGRRAQNITIMAKRRTGATARLVGKVRQWVSGD